MVEISLQVTAYRSYIKRRPQLGGEGFVYRADKVEEFFKFGHTNFSIINPNVVLPLL